MTARAEQPGHAGDGDPVRQCPINAQSIVPDSALEHVVRDLLNGGSLSEFYGGNHARRFEDAFARYHGPSFHAVAVNSGTSALHLALVAAGVGPGDEVIVPAFCFVAAATAVIQAGATPVICDVEPRSLMMEVDAAAALIGPRTRAVLPVHLWGYPADVASLRVLCDAHGLVLVEDTAQAPGAPVRERTTATFGDFATFSFAMRKHIRCGEGGMVLTQSKEAAERVRSLANMGKGPGWDEYRTMGFSYRMVEFSALVGLNGLARLDEEIAARQRAAEVYRAVLIDTGLVPLPDPTWGRSVYFKLPVLVPEGAEGLVDPLEAAILAENVSCRRPHRPLFAIPWLAEHIARAGRASGPGDCPVAAAHHPRLVEVETGPHLPEREAKKSADAVARVWRRLSGSAGS